VVVGTLRVELLIPNSRSLKDKRRVVRSVIDRLRHRFRVAAAEVEDNDVHNLAVLGFAAVSNDPRHARSIMSNVLEFLRNSPHALVGDHELELL
jgi:uncharacterized protein YlxP (DUF503 family)